jgi:hypothetical protein
MAKGGSNIGRPGNVSYPKGNGKGATGGTLGNTGPGGFQTTVKPIIFPGKKGK